MEVAALEGVVGELGGRGAADLLQRLRDPVVRAHAAARALALVKRLADEHVREHEAVGGVFDFADQRGLGRLLERGDDPVLRLLDERVEHLELELAADHRGDGDQLVGGLAQPGEPRADQLLDALGDPGGAARGQAAERLLDEERVAVRVLLQPQHEGVAAVVPGELLRLGGIEPFE
jgi:hypothetical protein